MSLSILGRKQSADNALFARVARDIELYVTFEEIAALVARTVAEIKQVVGQGRAAYGWSGGKDSIALGEVCRRAGITPCVMGLTRLEYPAFLAWVTDNMPDGLEVINTGQDLDWLAANPQMLFPQTSALAAKWFAAVQHTAQARYFKKRSVDFLLLGRRRADGNWVGKNGANLYSKEGVVRYSPLADWRHEDVLACNHYYRLPLPPVYDWPNGFVIGTGAWAARQYTGSIVNGWKEVYSIDPTVVRQAATRIVSARDFLEGE